MVKPNSSSKGEEEEDGPIAGEMNAGPTQLDVLGIGDKLFEQIFIHERFGDVSDEICFKEACQISQLQIGAIPTTQENSEEAVINVFAKDLRQGSSKFVCLYEGFKQPRSGTVMVSLRGALTNHIVLRGTYQTAPVTVYGFKLDSLAAMKRGMADGGDKEIDTPDDPVAYLTHVCASCPRQMRYVSGNYLSKEDLQLLKCFSDDTDDRSKKVIAENMDKLVSVASAIYDGNARLSKQKENGIACNSAIHVAVGWVSTFLAVFWDGRVCDKALIELGSNGLDVLALALQQQQSASAFVSHDGWALLRAVLGLRGLPGSFYNKVVSLTWILLKQGGVSACRVISETDCMQSRDIIIPANEVQDAEADVGKSNAGKRRRNDEKKQHVSKRVKMPDGSKASDSKSNNLVDMMKRIDVDRSYINLRSEFWDAQSQSEKTLLQCILDHSKRFKPSLITSLESAIGKLVACYGICRKVSDLLKDLKGLVARSSTRESEYMEVLDALRSLFNGLSDQKSQIVVQRLQSDAKEFSCSEDPYDAIVQELFVSYLESLRIPSELADVLSKLTEKFRKDDLQDFSSACVGIFCSICVRFGCSIMEDIDLTFISVEYLKICLQNELLASVSNVNRIPYKAFVRDFCGHLKASSILIKLRDEEWGTIRLPMLAILQDYPQSPLLSQVGDALLAKCNRSIKDYLGILRNEAFNVEIASATVNSFGVSLEVLSNVIALDSVRNLSWWVTKAEEMYKAISAVLKYELLSRSSDDIVKVQRILGGLFVSSRILTSGFPELIDLLGSQLPRIDIKEHSETLMDQSEYFEVLDAAFSDCSASASMSWDEIRLLLDEPERLGQLASTMRALNLYLGASEEASIDFQRKRGTEILLRCLVCATEVFSASVADRMWLHRTGAAIDICSIARNRKTIEQILHSATLCIFHYVKNVSRYIRLSSPSLLNALLRAHAAVSIDSQTIVGLAHQFDTNSSYSLRRIRWNLVKSLRTWVSCPHMKPLVIPTAVSGAVASATESGCTVAFSPMSLLSLSLLLGDIFPSEWPRKGYHNHLSIAEKKYRAALTEEIESCILPFEHYVSCCMSSELILVRAAAVRFISKGSGLGGGMGAFLIGVVSSHLTDAIKSSSFLHDMRQTLELLVPILYQPALKAAALDSSIPIHLSNLVESILHQSIQEDPNFDVTEATSVLTMALECLTILSDESISLDVFNLPGSSNVDVLQRDAGALISCTILDHIAALGENIPIALNLLHLMSQNRRGRENILHGVIALCTKSEQEKIMHPTMQQIMTGSQWLIQQYQIVQAQVPDENVILVFNCLENILKRTCINFHADMDAMPLEKPKSAPSRFAAVAKEASARSSADEPPAFLSAASFYQMLHDSKSLGIFWTNRFTRPQSKAPVTMQAKLSKYIGWDIGQELNRFCVADILHPWFTHPMRPLNENMIPQPEAPDLGMEPSPVEHQVEAAHISLPHKGEETTARSPSKLHEQEDPALQQATRVELEALDNILTAQIDQGEDQDVEEEADVDLYADLYPAVAAEEDKSLKSELVEMKEEEQAEERTDHESDRVEQVNIDFAESSSDEEEEEQEQADEDNGQKSEENATKEEDVEREGDTSTPKTEDTPIDTPAGNILNLGAEELQELLKDRSKVEDLLAKNPILLEKLKERLKK